MRRSLGLRQKSNDNDFFPNYFSKCCSIVSEKKENYYYFSNVKNSAPPPLHSSPSTLKTIILYVHIYNCLFNKWFYTHDNYTAHTTIRIYLERNGGFYQKIFIVFFIAIFKNHTLLCRFSNCKLAVQSKVGLQRLTQLGYSNVHRWDVIKALYICDKMVDSQYPNSDFQKYSLL